MGGKKLQLSLIMGANDRSRPVLDGAVEPDGIDLTCTVAHPSEIFWRQLHFQEFDVSEMSLSSLLMAMAGGNRDWVGIPVFTSRRFFHTGIWVRADRGIEKPEDLKGKQVGVPEYQQTAALWSRGVLKHEFGVDATDIEWWMERTPERSHGGATGFRPPEGVKFHQIPAEENIGTMLMDGKLDATLLYLTDPNLVDRSRIRLEGNPQFRLLFPDQAVNAFRLAKERVNSRMRDLAQTHFDLGLLGGEARTALQVDAYPYGVKSNLKVLETVADYSHEQGLTPRRMQMDEVFAPSTLDL